MYAGRSSFFLRLPPSLMLTVMLKVPMHEMGHPSVVPRAAIGFACRIGFGFGCCANAVVALLVDDMFFGSGGQG